MGSRAVTSWRTQFRGLPLIHKWPPCLSQNPVEALNTRKTVVREERSGCPLGMG